MPSAVSNLEPFFVDLGERMPDAGAIPGLHPVGRDRFAHNAEVTGDGGRGDADRELAPGPLSRGRATFTVALCRGGAGPLLVPRFWRRSRVEGARASRIERGSRGP